MKSAGNRFLCGCSLLIVALVSIVVWNRTHHKEGEVYNTYASPDGKYKVVVYRIPMPMVFPGQSSDASGYVQLQTIAGKVLEEEKVNMVQNIEMPVWSQTNVEIKLFADWNLPK